MYLTLAVRRAYQQAVDDRHCDVELLEDFRFYRCLTRTVAGSEQHMTSERWERLSAKEVPFTLYLLISVLVIDATAPADHIDRIVIAQLKLTIQLCDVVTAGRSRIENLIFESAEYCRYMLCALR